MLGLCVGEAGRPVDHRVAGQRHSAVLDVLDSLVGVAAETALKLKETSGVLAEALSAAEIQHGPKAVIGPGFPILAYGLDDPGGQDSRAFATDLAGAGARVMVASHAPAVPDALHLPLPPPLHPLLDPLAEALARNRGRDPDRPPGLLKVTRTF